jgi:hypothetical protein
VPDWKRIVAYLGVDASRPGRMTRAGLVALVIAVCVAVVLIRVL